jgi:hypothetical protein
MRGSRHLDAGGPNSGSTPAAAPERWVRVVAIGTLFDIAYLAS